MTTPVFPPEMREAFAACYPHSPAKLTHGLLGHPLLTLDALADLASALPVASIEYNPGTLPIGIAPDAVPKAAISVQEAIREVDTAGCWVVLKRIEQIPAYAALLRELLGELEGEVLPRTGPMLQTEAFVFVTAPGGVTPFHFDPEHNILLQLRGSKTMTLFPHVDEHVFPDEAQELFHLGQHHRNLTWRDEFAQYGEAITIAPGEAIHVPVKTPHWVQNGPEPSISLSITWRSEWSYAEADARAFNHLLRGMGLNPARPAAYPSRNMTKSLAWRAYRKVRKRA